MYYVIIISLLLILAGGYYYKYMYNPLPVAEGTFFNITGDSATNAVYVLKNGQRSWITTPALFLKYKPSGKVDTTLTADVGLPIPVGPNIVS